MLYLHLFPAAFLSYVVNGGNRYVDGSRTEQKKYYKDYDNPSVGRYLPQQ